MSISSCFDIRPASLSFFIKSSASATKGEAGVTGVGVTGVVLCRNRSSNSMNLAIIARPAFRSASSHPALLGGVEWFFQSEQLQPSSAHQQELHVLADHSGCRASCALTIYPAPT